MIPSNINIKKLDALVNTNKGFENANTPIKPGVMAKGLED